MSEMRQCAADSHREIRGESGAAVLGMFGVSEVPGDADCLKCRREAEMVACPLLLSGRSFKSP